MSAGRGNSCPDVIKRAAYSPHILPIDGFRVDLPRQIDFKCRVDRNEVVKLRQNLRIVSVFGSLNQEVGVVIREAKQLLGTNQGSGNRAACVDWLECIRDDTRLYQFRDAVSDHTGVNAELRT